MSAMLPPLDSAKCDCGHSIECMYPEDCDCGHSIACPFMRDDSHDTDGWG